MEGNTEATAHPIAEPNGHPPDFNVGGSAEAAALPSIGGDDRPVGIAMEDLTYNRHEPKTLTVRGLHYEVETKGLEWWQALSSFQLPWGEGGCCHKGATQSKREVLHNVSFEVKSGEMLAVLGSSGWLLHLLSGLSFHTLHCLCSLQAVARLPLLMSLHVITVGAMCLVKFSLMVGTGQGL